MSIYLDELVKSKNKLKIGFIGCGGHAYRNIFPTFPYLNVELVCTCDLDMEKAEHFAKVFGAKSFYTNHIKMLENEKLDAVFIVTGYQDFKPVYPLLAIDCMNYNCDVFIEKPPASSTKEILEMMEVSKKTHKKVMVGFKKMFFPANIKAKDLMQKEEFGKTSLVLLQYPQCIPESFEIKKYFETKKVDNFHIIGFLDHLCHPLSLMIKLLGIPVKFLYSRSFNGSGVVNFYFKDDCLCSISLTHGSSMNGGMERTMIISDQEKHIIVENNISVKYCQNVPNLNYGVQENYFQGEINETISLWEPEFSLGNLYNKGIFLLGYFNEVREFVECVSSGKSFCHGTLEEAYYITKIFELFKEGENMLINIEKL